MTLVQTAAILLRGHDYGDTSRILRFHTREHGLVSVMARGVRGRAGKGATALPTFGSGELTAYVRPHRDLHTMKDFACTRFRHRIAGDVLRFAGASVAAELMLHHTDLEPRPEIFHALEEGLDALEQADAPAVPAGALSMLWRLTAAFGFAPQLEVCVQCGAAVPEGDMARFDLRAGGVRCPACAQDAPGAPRVGPAARAQIHALLAADLTHPVTHPRRHLAFLADFLAQHVLQRPLKSMGFLASRLPDEDDGGGEGG